jgi:hypothetical protein
MPKQQCPETAIISTYSLRTENEAIISRPLITFVARPHMDRTQTVAGVLRSIADDRSLELFKTVALEMIDSDSLKKKTKLTRKQYYSRLSRMTKAGLVRKKSGKYILTTFGKIVFEAQATIQNGLNNYWELKTIDSLEISNELPKEEQEKLIDKLLENNGVIKQILVKKEGLSAEPVYKPIYTSGLSRP